MKAILNRLPLKDHWGLIFWVVGVLIQGFLLPFPFGWLGAGLVAWQGRKFYFSWAFGLGLLLDFLQGAHLGLWMLTFLLTGWVINFIQRRKQGRNGIGRLDLPY